LRPGFIEVRHCRTALPHKRTVLSPESFASRGGARNMVPRPQATAARPSHELPAQTAGVAGHARRQAVPAAGFCRAWPHRAGHQRSLRTVDGGVARIRCADRIVSHKLVTYFDASIPSCARAVDRRVPVVRRLPAGVWSGFLLPIYLIFAPPFLRLTAVYAHLFEAMALNLLALREFAPFFRGCGSAARHCRTASTRRTAVVVREN